jgi:hypothetical protein
MTDCDSKTAVDLDSEIGAAVVRIAKSCKSWRDGGDGRPQVQIWGSCQATAQFTASIKYFLSE